MNGKFLDQKYIWKTQAAVAMHEQVYEFSFIGNNPHIPVHEV